MCVHVNASYSDLEDLVARIALLHQEMNQHTQKYHQAKDSYRTICKEFYKTHGSVGIFIENAPDALEKAQKWVNQFDDEPVDLECYLNAIADFEEAYEIRNMSDSYERYKLEVRVFAETILAEVRKRNRQIELPSEVEGTLLGRLVEKLACREGFAVTYNV